MGVARKRESTVAMRIDRCGFVGVAGKRSSPSIVEGKVVESSRGRWTKKKATKNSVTVLC